MLNNLMRVTLTNRYDDDSGGDTTTIVSRQDAPALIEQHLAEIYESGIRGLKPRPTAEQVFAEAFSGWFSQLPDRYSYASYFLTIEPLVVWQPAIQTTKEKSWNPTTP